MIDPIHWWSDNRARQKNPAHFKRAHCSRSSICCRGSLDHSHLGRDEARCSSKNKRPGGSVICYEDKGLHHRDSLATTKEANISHPRKKNRRGGKKTSLDANITSTAIGGPILTCPIVHSECSKVGNTAVQNALFVLSAKRIGKFLDRCVSESVRISSKVSACG